MGDDDDKIYASTNEKRPAPHCVARSRRWLQPACCRPAGPGRRHNPPPRVQRPPRPGPPSSKPVEATKPSESAMQPGDIVKSPSDPVVGVVEGHMIYLSDVGRAVPLLPENLRGLPFDTLFPVVLDRIIDHQALVAVARRRHLDDDPAVKRDIEAATNRILEGALLARDAAPNTTEDKIQARYTKQYVGKPATEETHARHILVSTEEEAKQLIAELNKGADFATLAKQSSKDPDRRERRRSWLLPTRPGVAGVRRCRLRPAARAVLPDADPQRIRLAYRQGGGAAHRRPAELFRCARRAAADTVAGGGAAHDRRGARPAHDPQVQRGRLGLGCRARHHARPAACETAGHPAQAVNHAD